jgi:hypothetical protein
MRVPIENGSGFDLNQVLDFIKLPALIGTAFILRVCNNYFISKLPPSVCVSPQKTLYT